jgi:hypothetical protein
MVDLAIRLTKENERLQQRVLDLVKSEGEMEIKTTDLQRRVRALQSNPAYVLNGGPDSIGNGTTKRAADCPKDTTFVGGFCNCSDYTKGFPAGHAEENTWVCDCGIPQPLRRQVATAICVRPPNPPDLRPEIR